jgi:hypothetical protein
VMRRSIWLSRIEMVANITFPVCITGRSTIGDGLYTVLLARWLE